MLKIMPQIILKTNQYKMGTPNIFFSSAQLSTNTSNEQSQPKQSTILDKKVSSPFSFNPIKLPWVKDKNITEAVNHLNKLKFDPQDVQHVQSLGAVLPFYSGKEAVKYIENSHIEIKFAPMPSKNIHAQYDFDDNCININDLYKNSQNSAEIFAISEAILHEAGHAKDQDGKSSLQEEMDCLALNALAHRAFTKNYPNVFDSSNSLIVKDGVSVYAEMFFDNDITNQSLIKRLNLKYGHLPTGDFKHPPSNIANESKY